MKQNLFKRLASYFTEIHIESTSSHYNDILEVTLSKGRYRLSTENAIYSWSDKYDNFRKCFERLNLERNDVQNVLILGFGLGSIPYMLEKTYGKDYSYTGVEIDEAVIYLASKYVLDELSSEIELVCADASIFVQQNQVLYDMICIDLFIDDEIPEVFLTTAFLEDVKECLSQSGFIVFNHLYYYAKDKQKAENYHTSVFKCVFPQSACLDVHMNRMMISDREAIKM